MARSRGGRNLLPGQVLDQFKYEVAGELGLSDKIRQVGWPEMPTRECGVIGGHIGGNMVRVMIKYAEEALGKGQSVQ
ncbi:MAG: alpha/beta-type small acid-soluble spore protein [Bacillota bacterium]|nr:MAG: alpha/beta-type small acid-soluble spore protein [Bacillota bacterium]